MALRFGRRIVVVQVHPWQPMDTKGGDVTKQPVLASNADKAKNKILLKCGSKLDKEGIDIDDVVVKMLRYDSM